MSTLAAILFGCVAVTCFIMVFSWGAIAGTYLREKSVGWLWSKVCLVCIGLTITSTSLGILSALRAYEALVTGNSAYPLPAVGIGFLAVLWIGHLFFVRARAIDESTRHVRWPWPATLFGCALWSGLVILFRY